MRTINDVMNFPNQLELFDIISGVEYNTFIVIRKILIDEFSNVDFDKLIELLRTLVDLYIEYLRKTLYFDESLITTLGGKIFDMYDQKMVEENDA